jgi:hypothetical protein
VVGCDDQVKAKVIFEAEENKLAFWVPDAVDFEK